ncbi:MAG: hypothetical protein A4E52_01648 [Pelotomaculum sp. PtaB.Bin013]|uniref:DUF5655 domain-containing protein n=1 Tax=Pelotomaculum isophthalicicum JI TaxID=947010 RepID=A0A9X4H5N5_9FIRM|nr:DUF5655 domain-containing protein [Pelotomaculum isophthalicicum]MDF9407784.1 hypothetical protein [Pelotomaculum isophthalicicum JI]OPX85411.1 MAG: hypothetical protein A4E52_01648 [Pelotomaculum sp. PtaB.Bin013]
MASTIFFGVRAKLLPLYEQLRGMAMEKLGAFDEHETSSAMLWRHHSAFAEISAKKGFVMRAFWIRHHFNEHITARRRLFAFKRKSGLRLGKRRPLCYRPGRLPCCYLVVYVMCLDFNNTIYRKSILLLVYKIKKKG